MSLDSDQRGIVRQSALALVSALAVLGAGWVWLPPDLFGLGEAMPAGERIAFALKADLPLFVWLSLCVRAVSSGRFRSPADRLGSAFGPPSPAIAVPAAVLQNSLEQTVLAFGGTLALAAVLRGPELVLLPLLVLLFLLGRVSFALGYRKGAPGRAFGMALTAAPVMASYVLTPVLMAVGR